MSIMSSDNHPRASPHHAPPTRSLLIVPLLALLCISWLIVSEVGYLLPISRVLKARQDNERQWRPWRVIRSDYAWVLQDSTKNDTTRTSHVSKSHSNDEHESIKPFLRHSSEMKLKERENNKPNKVAENNLLEKRENEYMPGGVADAEIDQGNETIRGGALATDVEKATEVMLQQVTAASKANEAKNSETSQPDHNASANSFQFDRIVLLGERHSGTSYTTRMLAKCFPTLDVSDFLVRYKHWFQPTPEYVVNATKTFLHNKTLYEKDEDMHKVVDYWPKISSLENSKTVFNRTLVIVMFRNVYDWLEAMRLGPHHMPNHFTMFRFENAPVPNTTDNPWYGSNYSSWKTFVSANMTLDSGSDGLNETRLCQNAYYANEVSPCRVSKSLYPDQVKKDYPANLSAAPDDLPFNAHNPIYELKPNGEPYENILELRTAKIRNFMEIPKMWDVGGFMTLQHEDVNSKGSGFLLDQISTIVGMKPSCRADPPKNQTGKVLEKEWAVWISQNADWEAEGLLGYKKQEH